jgi:hypothetical protein
MVKAKKVARGLDIDEQVLVFHADSLKKTRHKEPGGGAVKGSLEDSPPQDHCRRAGSIEVVGDFAVRQSLVGAEKKRIHVQGHFLKAEIPVR